jgi:hypothetical protein
MAIHDEAVCSEHPSCNQQWLGFERKEICSLVHPSSTKVKKHVVQVLLDVILSSISSIACHKVPSSNQCWSVIKEKHPGIDNLPADYWILKQVDNISAWYISFQEPEIPL